MRSLSRMEEVCIMQTFASLLFSYRKLPGVEKLRIILAALIAVSFIGSVAFAFVGIEILAQMLWLPWIGMVILLGVLPQRPVV
jgi:hypothetical protein